MTSLLLLALAPVVFLLGFVYLRDCYEREPLSRVLSVYLWGMPVVVPAAALEVLGGLWLAPSPVVESFLLVGLCEEACKYLGSMLLFYRSFEFNEEMDGVVYAVALGLGFATAENLLYVVSHGIETGVLRALMAVPGHAMFAIVMGLYLGRAKFSSGIRKVDNQVKALFIPAVLHGMYDYFLSANLWLLLLVVPFLVCLWWTGLSGIRRAQDASPYKRHRR